MKRWNIFFAMAVLWSVAVVCRAGNYTNFAVAVYIPINVVQGFDNAQRLSNDWNCISSQLKVDKVYIEVQRDRRLLGDDLAERVKKFFLDHGVQVAGGMALSDGSIGGQFKSFCYTDPSDRAFIKSAAQLAARHFDEVIQDDFFFVTTKYDSDIAAKGAKNWSDFRLSLMDEAAENLVVKPARAVNPHVKMIVKFPNWYEHFTGSGYDLDKEPKIFDGIYTGTETRDPIITDQHLQPYESYEIFRYFENIAPSRNGGGWVDTYSIRYLDRYASQLWDTAFAKAPQIMLFEWSALTRPIEPGDRHAWEKLPTSFNYDQLLADFKANPPAGMNVPTAARIAGYALEHADQVVGLLGQPIGIASYRPCHASGEDFLHNYLGMLGIPIDLRPEFPTNANVTLLTEAASADPDIVAKIKNQLRAGKSVVITSGLLRALQGKGIEDIGDIHCTERRILAHRYSGGFGAGNFATFDDGKNPDVLFPEIDFLTNDGWSLVRADVNGNAFPLLLMDRYSRGILYVWTMPDNLADLYALPSEVTRMIKNYVMHGFPVRIDGPANVALYAYDNGAFVIESYLPGETDITVTLAGHSSDLKNLVTGEKLPGQALAVHSQNWRGEKQIEDPMVYKVHLLPYSYIVFAAEK